MNDKPAEILVYEFLAEVKAAADSLPGLSADERALLAEMTIHDTVYQNITRGQNYGIRLGETASDFAPEASGEYAEWDAEVPLAVFARVSGAEKSNRAVALQKVFDAARLAAKLIARDQHLGGRVCDSLVLRWTRGFDEMDGEAFAVANTSLIVNPSGTYDFSNSRK